MVLLVVLGVGTKKMQIVDVDGKLEALASVTFALVFAHFSLMQSGSRTTTRGSCKYFKSFAQECIIFLEGKKKRPRLECALVGVCCEWSVGA